MILQNDLRSHVKIHVYKKYIREFEDKINNKLGSESYIIMLEDFLCRNGQKINSDINRIVNRVKRKKFK